MDRLAQTRAILADLVAFPTVSSESNLGIIAHIADRLDAAGARVEVLPDPTGQKANLFATLGPDAPTGGLVLSGHTDVVPVADQAWSSDPFRLREADGRLYGRGSCDMKGFVAAVLALVPVWARLPLARPLHIALTHDEEVGCLGGRALVADLAARGIRPAIALIGEPTEMRIVEAHKGCCEYTVDFTGREGHGSDPDAGVNAAAAAVRYAGRLMELAEALKARAPAASPFSPPWTSVNIGRIAGGQVHNVIPARAELAWEMRPVTPADMDFAKAWIARVVAEDLLPAMQAVAPEAGISTRVIGEVAALAPEPGSPARALLAELTGETGALTVPFSTEAGLFQALGCSAAVCGPGSIAQAHKADEYLSLDQLARCLTMLERLSGALTR